MMNDELPFRQCHVVCGLFCHEDPRDMLNNFCLHVCAQNSLFIAENCNVFFDSSHSITLSPDIRVHRAGSQLKMFKMFKMP